MLTSPGVHPRAGGEVLRALVAAMQHEHERQRRGFMHGWDIELVAARRAGMLAHAVDEGAAVARRPNDDDGTTWQACAPGL
ncbi:hypothetical protein [Thiomonas delicata]|uniref:hypothetical protein n=1 Tax=Thiomonas delicata TaxID=364030 RepID=UPI001FE529A7|nr:hypothetical protein [Thiomonas delicata]